MHYEKGGANMANAEHLALLERGVAAWNLWRCQNPDVEPDLTEADLSGVDLSEADLSEADLGGAKLVGANLRNTDLSGSYLPGANLYKCDLTTADLSETFLRWADLSRANLTEANLSGADLRSTYLARTLFTGADLSGCKVYGIAAWDLQLDDVIQSDLIITDEGEPNITVDSLEVAQFVYLLLTNPKLHDVIDTVTTKIVLLLGRFTQQRLAVLEALRTALRQNGYVPILFNFTGPESQNVLATVVTVARLARFVV